MKKKEKKGQGKKNIEKKPIENHKTTSSTGKSEKKVKKKIKLKLLPIMIVIIALVILVLLGKYISLIPIKNIYLVGNQVLSDQQLIELAGIEDYPSFLLTSSKKMKKGIEKNPLIADVKIQKGFFGKVTITVKEHEILFRKQDNGKLVLDDQTEVDDEDSAYSVSLLLNYVPSNKYDAFVSGMNKLKASVRTQISEITYDPNEQDKDRFLLYMTDGNYVYLTLTKFTQLNYYEDVLEKIGSQKGILYLDSGNHFQIME